METGRWSKPGTAQNAQEPASPREPQPASLPLNVLEGPSLATEAEGGSVYSGRGEGESGKPIAVGGSSKLAATRALWLSCQHADPNVFSFLFYLVEFSRLHTLFGVACWARPPAHFYGTLV